jgi:4-amino-4-deoxy-L-arabinose transferase-like glycosyltransferase
VSAETRKWKSNRAASRWILILGSLLAFGTRVYHLGSQSLWADEAKSVVVSSWPLLSIITEQASHEHPPLHYLLLHFLMPLAGRSEFAVRYVSLFFGVLLVPLLYVVGKMLAGERVGVLAALVAALSPFYVRFAQETRMYTLAIFFSLLSTYFFLKIVFASERSQRPERGRSLGYVFATAAALYSHYFTLFIVAAQMIYVLLAWLCRRAPLKPWLWRMLGGGLLFLPWILLMVQGILSIDPELRTSGQAAGPNAPVSGILSTLLEGRAGMASLPAILRQSLISFGPSDFAGLEATPWLALGFVLVIVVGLWKYPKPAWRWKFWLLLAFCLPLILGFLIGFPVNRPLWAKYFGVASSAFYLLVALGLAVLVSGKYRRIVGLALIAGVAGLSILSLRNYFTDTRYGRYDIRPHIESLESSALPGDALLINPWTHFPTFWHYYRTGHPGAETGPDVYYPLEWTDTEKELETIADRHLGVWVIKNMPNDFDADGAIESWLVRHAFPTATVWADNVRIRYYSLPGPTAAEQADQVPYGESAPVFGSQIALSGYSIAPQTQGHRRDLQMTLFWQAIAAPNSSYSVYAHLVDGQGRIWGQSDSPPLAGFYPTREWTPGERVEDRLGLPVLPGTPPGTYWVRLGLYRADDGARLPVTWPGGVPEPGSGPAPEPDSLWLGPVELGRAETPPAIGVLGMTRPLETARALGNLDLLGYSLETGTLEPGEPIPLTLFWRAGDGGSQDYHVILRLEDEEGQNRAESREGVTAGAYPLSLWVAGEVVRDPRQLQLAGDASPGRYRLVAALVDPATNAEVEAITIDQLAVQARSRLFTAPAVPHPLEVNLGGKVRFLGYSLANGRGEGGETGVWRIEGKPRDSLHLTLYWQALAPMDVSYTVFTHLLDGNNAIWGQHDSVPGGGNLPTTGWVVDQVIEDKYLLTVKPDAPAGGYAIEVGMYDAATGRRLEVLSAEGESMGDRILLPVQVLVK